MNVWQVARKREARRKQRQDELLADIRGAADAGNTHPLKQWQDKTDAAAAPLQVGQRPALLKIPRGAVGVVGLGSGNHHVVEPTQQMRAPTPGNNHRVSNVPLVVSSPSPAQWGSW